MNLLRETAAGLGVALSPAELEKFETYYRELVAWNRRMNLTAITDYDEVQVRHFADSLAVLLAADAYDRGASISLVDVGSGAGFPGLPLKILRSHWRVVLVESTRKKTTFLQHLIHELELERTEVVWARAEAVARNAAYREQFDLAVARAVAEMATLAEYALPLVRVGGRFIAHKGTDPGDELRSAGQAIDALGGAPAATIPYRLPALDEPLHLVVIGKVSPTPARYPRRAGMPAKRPLG